MGRKASACDRYLFLRMTGTGEIYSSAWIGGHLRTHGAQLTATQKNVKGETVVLTQQALDKAAELGHDLPAYWIDLLGSAELHQLEFLCRKIKKRYPKPLRRAILDDSGVAKRWSDLKTARKRGKRHNRGLLGKLRNLIP